jgi:organic radical activating enzyme
VIELFYTILQQLNRLMDKSATSCVMPHLGIALQNDSDFCCCNINKASWQNKQRQVMYVYTDPLDLVYQSHTRKMVAATLDNGMHHSSCQACWDVESAGGTSARLRFNKMFGHVEPMLEQPRILIIKPGNVCNYACRMCNPVTSSSWYADGYELEKAGLESSSWYGKNKTESVQALTFNEYTKSFETVRNSFNSDHTQLWDTLKKWIKNLVLIDIYGGEPFLTPAIFNLLQHGIDIGVSKNIQINLHTNASIFNQQYLDILSHYKQVFFNISLDSDQPKQLEYIRHRANFTELKNNTIDFKKWADQNSNVEMKITCTITPLNVYYIDNIITGLTHMFKLNVSQNLVTTPEYDIRHLPQPVKSYLIDTIKNPMITSFLQQTISGCDTEWPKFCQATNKLDQLRNQSFSDTFPEWWEMLKLYWIQ